MKMDEDLARDLNARKKETRTRQRLFRTCRRKGCTNSFSARRKTAKYCSARCKQAAWRDGKE